MDRFRISLEGDSLDDSRGESEIFRLREEIKRKDTTIQEKEKIIASLRQQLQDLQHDAEELETSEQLMRQKVDRLKKEINEKNEIVESISHAMKEVETANENLKRGYDARSAHIIKIHEELTRTKKDLEEAKTQGEEFRNENELLQVELEAARRRRPDRDQDLQDRYFKELEALKSTIAQLNQRNEQLNQKNEQLMAETKKGRTDQSTEELMIELYDLRAQVKSLNHRQSRRSIDEEILKLKQELEVSETSWRLERQHKERYARENLQLDRRVNELLKELQETRAQQQQQQQQQQRVQQQREQHENKPELTSAIHFSTADEVGEIMDQSSSLEAMHYCPNHRIKKSQFLPTKDEQKMRLERANELARRNMQTKPLHQTSYPLELDTFGTTDLTETDIKRGLYVPRPALNDTSNQRRPVKKAEAFIV